MILVEATPEVPESVSGHHNSALVSPAAAHAWQRFWFAPHRSALGRREVLPESQRNNITHSFFVATQIWFDHNFHNIYQILMILYSIESPLRDESIDAKIIKIH